MRISIVFLLLSMLTISCSYEDSIIDNPVMGTSEEDLTALTEEQIQVAELTNQGFIGLKSILETTLVTIFQYPQIHGSSFSEIETRSSQNGCPMISPDPHAPIEKYPAEFMVDFGKDGCRIEDHPIPTQGKMKLIIDGEICVAIGSKVNIHPEADFAVNGYRCTSTDGGGICLTYGGRDEDGNLCFNGDLSNIVIIDAHDRGVIWTDIDDARIKVIDRLKNNDPNNYATYIDDEISLTYSVLYCGKEYDLTSIIPWLKQDGSYQEMTFNFGSNCPVSGDVDIYDADGNQRNSLSWGNDEYGNTIDGQSYSSDICN